MTEETVTALDLKELKDICSGIRNGHLISTHHPDEQRAVAAILPAICESVGYDFPLSIVHRDKPDFLLHFNEHSIGLEVTRFLATALAHATATASRLHTGFIPTRFNIATPQMSRKEMECAVLEPSVGLADCSPIFDPHLVDQLVAIVEDKKQKILFGGDAMGDEHWLLIDDRHMMSTAQLDYVVMRFLQRLVGHWATTPHFTKILILSRSVLFDLNERELISKQL